MAGIKKRGPASQHTPRTYKGQRVRPTRYIKGAGKGIMCGIIVETDELVRGNDGEPLPWRSIQ